MADESGFEWLCRQLDLFFVFDAGGISFSSGLRLIQLITQWALSFHRKLTGCPFYEFCACLSVRCIAGSQIRTKLPILTDDRRKSTKIWHQFELLTFETLSEILTV